MWDSSASLLMRTMPPWEVLLRDLTLQLVARLHAEAMARVQHPETSLRSRQRLPLGSLLALTASGFLTIMLETVPADILPEMSGELGISESVAGQTVTG